MWGGICEASDEFVDVSDALNGPQGTAIPNGQTISGVPVKETCS